jgi:pimeloyl-CoA synthetase
MKLNNEIKKIHDLLVETNLFLTHPFQKDLEDIDSTPHHLKCVDGRVVLYLDHKKPEYYSERGVKIKIMDWSRKNRKEISFQEFYELTTEEVKLKLLFFSHLFRGFNG